MYDAYSMIFDSDVGGWCDVHVTQTHMVSERGKATMVIAQAHYCHYSGIAMCGALSRTRRPIFLHHPTIVIVEFNFNNEWIT